MDKLGNQLANVSLYDVKAYVRKAQNAVLNFSDMEAKVREATNNEPWGASTSVMQQIARGTHNHQQFHEIMPFIYRRFTEKTASEWRQIYKSLQLLEFLIKNGAERVVDYARSHTMVIEMLRNFHYVDSKNRDQGINIRNRAGELLELLGSVDKIRQERKKAKQLNQKTGIASAVSSETTSHYTPRASRGGDDASSSRPQYGSGAHTQRVYGDGGFNGSFAEARVDDDDDFAEYEVAGASTSQAPPPPPPHTQDDNDDDEFDDFQSAPTASAAPAAATNTNASILDLFGSAPMQSQPQSQPQSFSQSNSLFDAPTAPTSAPAPAKDAFGSLWETSKTNPVKPKPAPTNGTTASTTASTSAPAAASGSVDDLLMF